MFNQLEYKKKFVVLIALMLLVIYGCYVFAFKLTFAAISLNRELKSMQTSEQVMDEGISQIERKNAFYRAAVKRYVAKKDGEEQKVWQSLSQSAIDKRLAVTLNPELVGDADTNAVNLGLKNHDFVLKGSYPQVVRFLDTLGRIPGIGQVSTLELARQKDNTVSSPKDGLQLKLTLSCLLK